MIEPTEVDAEPFAAIVGHNVRLSGRNLVAPDKKKKHVVYGE